MARRENSTNRYQNSGYFGNRKLFSPGKRAEAQATGEKESNGLIHQCISGKAKQKDADEAHE